MQVDPFLYKEQMMLYNWRGHFLDQYSCYKYRCSCITTEKLSAMFFICCRLTDEEGFVLVHQFDQVVEEAVCPFAFTSRYSPRLFCPYVASVQCFQRRIAANQRVAREVAAKFSWSPDSWPQFMMEIASAAQVLVEINL